MKKAHAIHIIFSFGECMSDLFHSDENAKQEVVDVDH